MFLLVMAISMFASTAVVLYFALKQKTPNKFLWLLIPFFRGIEWLLEYIVDFIDSELNITPPFYLDRFELIFGLLASMVILAACLEFNGVIQKPLGKIMVIFISITPIFFLIVLKEDVILAIEENYLFEGFLLISDPFRFLYGFIILIIALVVLILTHIIYIRQVRKNKVPKDDKMQSKIVFMILLIAITSIFNGFDFEQSVTEEATFIIMRGVTTIPFIILPIFVILTNKAELNVFIILKSNGIPIYALDLQKRIEIKGSDVIILTSGFLAALTSFSQELSSKTQSTLTITSGNLYYLIYNTDKYIYSLQAGYYTKYLETKFNKLSQDYDKFLSSKEEISALEEVQIKNILLTELSEYL